LPDAPRARRLRAAPQLAFRPVRDARAGVAKRYKDVDSKTFR